MCGETESMFVDASFGAFDRPSRPSEVRSSEVADFCLLGWLAGWLVGLLACWLVGWLAGRCLEVGARRREDYTAHAAAAACCC